MIRQLAKDYWCLTCEAQPDLSLRERMKYEIAAVYHVVEANYGLHELAQIIKRYGTYVSVWIHD
jgi:hypothetical protein